MVSLAEISRYLDSLLRTEEFLDYPNALNGVQVDVDAEIHGVAAAVDARQRSIQGALDAGANLLLVHHGLFWGGLQPLRGPHLRRVQQMLRGRLALYSSHLPLDAHPSLGNNVLLARELGLVPAGGFARYGTIDIGVTGDDDVPTSELLDRVALFATRNGGIARCSGFPENAITRRWAICTGSGASAETLQEAVEKRVDTLIVGEGPHWTAVDADEIGLAIIYAGHYATETLGVRALAQNLSDAFSLPWSFIDVPTGL
ncbi:MAG: Nif3-like dinuclear metal center hexameric protein [Gemmatimonadaceae bacterium]